MFFGGRGGGGLVGWTVVVVVVVVDCGGLDKATHAGMYIHTFTHPCMHARNKKRRRTWYQTAPLKVMWRRGWSMALYRTEGSFGPCSAAVGGGCVCVCIGVGARLVSG